VVRRIVPVVLYLALAPLCAWAQQAPAQGAGQAPAQRQAAKPDASALYQELDREIQGLQQGQKPQDAAAQSACQAGEKAGGPSYPFLEHHGYFRFRANGYFRLHLGTQNTEKGIYTSGFEPPLTENRINNESGGEFSADTVGSSGEDWIADANMRLRYSPTLHISPDLSVHTQFDILDNLVLGSTPDFGGYQRRADVPLVLYSPGQVPPTAGVNAWQDSVRVKQAFGEWHLPLGTIRIGRMADDFGLGLVHNGGQGLDADYGDFVDRASLLLPFTWFKLMLAYDWVWEGLSNASATQFLGQAHDYDDADDVKQVVLSIFNKPLGAEERTLSADRLLGKHKPTLDWGLYLPFRWQKFDVSDTSFAGYQAGTTGYDQVQLVPRDAWVITPDLWLRLLYSPSAGSLIRLELEAAMAYGQVDNVLMTNQSDSSADIRQWGGVLQAEIILNQLSFGLEGGVASGDDTGTPGYWGNSPLVKADGSVNHSLSGFLFDRDYRTDLILYRYVMGGVTDSFYLKPWVAYDFLPGDEGALGLNFSLLYARALERKGVPGDAHNLGTELDFGLFFNQTDRFTTALDWGVLIPMAGLDRAAPPSEPSKWATLLRARMIWQF
jgi:uncharacterized protein (TIGR04551 family)